MGRRSQAIKEQGRQRLLQAAAAHFAQQGFESANINDIALAAGFAKGSVYNYFQSKEDLFGEVLSEACRRTVARYGALPHDGSLRASLTALVAADVAILREEEDFMKVLMREAMSFRRKTYPLIIRHLEPFLAAVGEILARGVQHGEVRGDKPVSQLALLFVGTLTLLYVQHWSTDGAWPTLEELPELAVTVFLDGAGCPVPGDHTVEAGP